MLARLRGQAVNVVLALVAIALVVTVVITSGKVTTDERLARENNLLSAFREEEITRIALTRGDQELVVERGETDEDAGTVSWRLTKPFEEEAEAYAMQSLLGALEFATWLRRLDPAEVDRAKFGLEQPKWRLTITMGAIRYELRLGNEAASPAGSHYLELVAEGAPGSGVGVINRDLASELGVDAATLRGRQLMPYLSNALSQIVIEGPGGSRRFASLGQNRWRFEGMHGNARVNRDAFDAVLLQFARTKAEHFIDAKQAEQALKAAGDGVIRVTQQPADASKPKGIVEIGGVCPESENGVVARRLAPDPVAACVPKSVLPGLSTPADVLIDRDLFSLRKDEIESLAAERGNEKLALERSEKGFVLRAPVKADVQLDTGNQHLEAIAKARGTLVKDPDLAKLGLKPPAGRVTLVSVAEKESAVIEEVVELGSGEPPTHVRRALDGVVLAIDRETARLLAAEPGLLRERKLLDLSPSEFTSVEITSKSLGVHQRIRREPSGAFTLELPKNFDHDASLATTLVDTLGALEADRWVAASDDGSFGLATPTLTAVITLELRDGATRTHQLTVGAPASGGHYARLDSLPGVFVLPRRVLDTLTTLLLDRSLFILTPDAIERVTLEHDGKSLTLVKRGQTLEAEGGETISPARVAEVTETLGSLRAEAALHLGAPRPDEGFAKPELVLKVDPSGNEKPYTIRIGAGDSWQGTSIHYARREGTDATYVIAKSKVRALLDAF